MRRALASTVYAAVCSLWPTQILPVSASEHRSRRGVVTPTYADPSGERQRAPAARVLRRATTPCPVLTHGANFEVPIAVLYCRRASNLCGER